MKEMDLRDMEDRLQTLQGGFASLYAVCAALAGTHPNKQAAKQMLEVVLEQVKTHYLNETFPEEVTDTIEHFGQDFLGILSR